MTNRTNEVSHRSLQHLQHQFTLDETKIIPSSCNSSTCGDKVHVSKSSSLRRPRSLEWPTEAAVRTKLSPITSSLTTNTIYTDTYYYPKHNDPYSAYDEDEYLLELHFNSTLKMLQILNSITRDVCDTIDPRDIIGADLEVRFIDEPIDSLNGGKGSNSMTLLAERLAQLESSTSDENDDEEEARIRKVGIFNEKSNRRAEEHAHAEEMVRKEYTECHDQEYETKRTEHLGKTLCTNNEKEDLFKSAQKLLEQKVIDDDKIFDMTLFNCKNFLSPDVSNTKGRTDAEDDNHATAFLNIYAYPRKLVKPGFIGRVSNWGYSSSTRIVNDEEYVNTSNVKYRKPHHRRFRVAPSDDFADARSVVRALRYLAKLGQFTDNSNTPNRSMQLKRYLVMINPLSGNKSAIDTYNNLLRPMLHQCGVEHHVLVTKYAGHAGERMTEHYTSTKVVVNVGEAERENISWYDAIVVVGGDGIMFEVLQGIRTRSDYALIMARMKFGIVACGTCNGMVASLLHSAKERYGVVESMFKICKGQSSRLDLSMYSTTNKSYLSFLTFSWGFVADVDIESECIRSMGILRNDIWGAWRILNLRHYRARFSYLTRERAQLCGDDGVLPLTQPVPSHWEKIEDDFILFWASHVTHAAYNVCQSPESHLQDGIFRILVVRKPCSRLTLTKILMTIDTGRHIVYNKAEFYECVAYRLEPVTKGSFNNLDGEVVEAGAIQAKVLPSAIEFFC